MGRILYSNRDTMTGKGVTAQADKVLIEEESHEDHIKQKNVLYSGGRLKDRDKESQSMKDIKRLCKRGKLLL